MAKGQDRYKEVRVFEYPNCIVRVHIPDLDADERARRMKQIHDAAAALLLDQERRMKHGSIHGTGAVPAHDHSGGHL